MTVWNFEIMKRKEENRSVIEPSCTFFKPKKINCLPSNRVLDRKPDRVTGWNNNPLIDILPDLNTLSWFRASQSLPFLLNAVCLAEKQQKAHIIIIISLKMNLFSPWYSWKITELALNNNHSLNKNISIRQPWLFVRKFLNQRALKELFNEASAKGDDWSFTITVSFIEIYNEMIR
jgi:hypothetical protein